MSLFFFILILVALIWVHELGHFSVAKLFGVRVDEFAIGFPPRLLRIRWGETDYTFNLLLVGGFVRIHGENAGEGAGDPRALTSKPRLVQAAVMLAGIAFNIIFAWLALSGGYVSGLQTSVDHQGFGEVQNARPMIVGVYPDSPASRAGFKGGDIVRAAHTGSATLENVTDAESLQTFIAAHQEESIIFTVERAGEEETLLAKAEEGLIEGKKAVGIQLDDVGVLQLPVHLALAQGALATKNLTISTAQGLSQFFGQLFTGRGDFSQVSGPIGIAQVGSQAVESGFAAAAVIAALISINLALINLIPIPGLDGGRLLFIIVESIIRRPISQKLSIGLTLAGFALIILLMVVVTYSDIAKLIG